MKSILKWIANLFLFIWNRLKEEGARVKEADDIVNGIVDNSVCKARAVQSQHARKLRTTSKATRKLSKKPAVRN